MSKETELKKYETLLVDIADGIAKVTLNRPDKRNAMNPQMHLDMADCLETLRYEKTARVIVFTGAGKSFCGGMDLKEFFHDLKQKNPDEYDRIYRISTDWRGRTLRYYPKPTIAMVNGFVFGGAFGFVEGCDLAFAADEATFGLSEINFRMFPGGCVSKALANILRSRDALLYAMSGDTFDGRKAAEMGFVNAAYPLVDLERETMNWARKIAAKDPDALKATKDAFRFSLEMSWEASMSYTAAKEQEVLMAQQGAWLEQGIGDFIEGKYKPGLQGNESVGK